MRLPPYHCFFNPIEFAWGYIKNEVAKLNTNEKKTLETVRELLQQVSDKVLKEHFKSWIGHCWRKEQEYRQKQLPTVAIPDLIISRELVSDVSDAESNDDADLE